jgi:sugar lactone lactonase YvrE
MNSLVRLAAFGAALAVCAFCSAQVQVSSGFEHVASYRSLGGLVATAIAPGPTPGSQRVYASYLYDDITFDVIAIDPRDGSAQVFHNPVPGEFGARNLAVAPNGDVYFGTLPRAHFMRLDWATHRMVDLGRPSASEEYIWDTTFGPDGNLYGVTYPQCRLVRYDPATGKLADLGRMDPTEKYGRWIVNGRDGYLYMGIGTAKANVAVYDTHTGRMREVLPRDAQIVGTAETYVGVDNKVHASVGDRLFTLSGFTIHEIDAKQHVPRLHENSLRDGTTVDLTSHEGTMVLHDAKTGRETSLHIGYDGEPLQVFRIAFGPKGSLYGSSILPAHLVRVDFAAHEVDNVGLLGGGELYSLLAHNGRIAMGAYAGLSPLMSYDPAQPFHPAPKGNPSFANFDGSDEHWRPQAMIEGTDGLIYVGGTAGYGQLEGPLVAWDGNSAQAIAYGNLVHNQSVVSLAVWQRNIVGGTTTGGGGGSHPTEKDARVFFWDAVAHKLLWNVIPVPGASFVTDLIASRSGLVYGIAVQNTTNTLFAIDPERHEVVSTQVLPFHSVPYNAVAPDSQGTIWGLGDSGIFRIEDRSHKAILVAQSPAPITAGLALQGHKLYFVSNSEVYCFDGVSDAAN